MINEFILPIIGLKLGEYSYQFQVNDKFFDEFDNDELKEGELQVDLILIKKSNFMELLFNVKGIIKSICDRCAGGLDLFINHHEMRIVKFAQVDLHNTDDVLIIGNDQHEIDVSHMVYETIALGIPYSKSHESSVNGQVCDKEVLDKLRTYQVPDQTNIIDERWSGLKKILTNKEK